MAWACPIRKIVSRVTLTESGLAERVSIRMFDLSVGKSAVYCPWLGILEMRSRDDSPFYQSIKPILRACNLMSKSFLP